MNGVDQFEAALADEFGVAVADAVVANGDHGAADVLPPELVEQIDGA
jgi:hypothetical protein